AAKDAAPAANETAPASPGDRAKSEAEKILGTGWWGTGNYFSITKIVLFIIVFWLWVYTADWMNDDMEHRKVESREMRNLQFFLIYLIGSAIAFYIPTFWAAFPITVLVWIVPAVVYVKLRNKGLPEPEKVWTRDHIVYVYAVLLSKIGVKVKMKKRMSYETGVPVELAPTEKGAAPQVLQGRLILARNAPGYNDFRAYLYDGLLRGADAIMFDYTPQKTVVRHQIDGVWIEIIEVPRVVEKGKEKDKLELALEAGKLLLGANPADRRSKQGGPFVATLNKTKYDCEFVSQGTRGGEAMMIQFVRQKVAFNTLDELGLFPQVQERLRTFLNAPKGFFVISAPPANGLRSSADVFIRNCDRFTRDVAAVEDVMHPDRQIENIILNRYDSSKGESPMTVLPDIFFKEPQAVVVREMVNVDSLTLCCEEVVNNRLIISTIKAKDAVEAMFRFLAMKVDPQLFASALAGVVCQRLVRKLCPECKEGFQPPPQLLQSLGFAPGTVKELFRVRSPLPPELEQKRKPCSTCNDIGYKGRTAIFELIELNDELRSLLVTQPNPAAIRQAVVKQRQPGFLQYGAELVRQGITSVDELSRVLKM
ncbi:MAG TPA: hypothetical protein DEB39_10090, partial [Planctomycetaceae bacterium]|nr:hypothetical protein [Planctomycetaceae bacterium]